MRYIVIPAEGHELNAEIGNSKNTKQYKYLGVTLTADGKDDRDI